MCGNEMDTLRLRADWEVAWNRVFYLEDKLASWMGGYSIGTSTVVVPFEEMKEALTRPENGVVLAVVGGG